MSVEAWWQEFERYTDSFEPDYIDRVDGALIVSGGNGNMTRFTVVVTDLGGSYNFFALEGGRYLVSVLVPWKAVYPVNFAGLHPSYVLEKFTPRTAEPITRKIAPSDAAGVYAAVTIALAEMTRKEQADV